MSQTKTKLTNDQALKLVSEFVAREIESYVECDWEDLWQSWIEQADEEILDALEQLNGTRDSDKGLGIGWSVKATTVLL